MKNTFVIVGVPLGMRKEFVKQIWEKKKSNDLDDKLKKVRSL